MIFLGAGEKRGLLVLKQPCGYHLTECNRFGALKTTIYDTETPERQR